jgi:heme-degrading monooxygenase HmoA
MVFVHLAIHNPRPGKAEAMLESMKGFGEAMKAAPGFVLHGSLRDERSTRLVGLAVWESRQAWEAAIGAAREAIADLDIDELLEEPPDVFLLSEADPSGAGGT